MGSFVRKYARVVAPAAGVSSGFSSIHIRRRRALLVAESSVQKRERMSMKEYSTPFVEEAMCGWKGRVE